VMVDDLGWSSVGFNRAGPQKNWKKWKSKGKYQRVITPAIDKLAKSGVILKGHYAGKMCAPSRSSFLSGRLPHHVNQRNHQMEEPGTGMPLGMSTIAEMLQKKGYATHHVGKWHLGLSSPDYLPVRRGFNSSLALLGGYADHFTFQSYEFPFTDLWLDEDPATKLRPAGDPTIDGKKINETHGVNCVPYSEAKLDKTEMCKKFSQDTYMTYTKEIIDKHDAKKPMFMFLSLQMPHGPLQVPNRFLGMYSKKIWEPRRYAYAMISSVDEAVKDLELALQQKGMWNDTLLLFFSDNGGSREHEANYPLRGAKGSDFEGGVRSASFVAGGFLPPTQSDKKLYGMIHVCDWWTTFAGLAGYNVSDWMMDPRSRDEERHGRSIPTRVKRVDSLDMWGYINGSKAVSPRTTLVTSAVKSEEKGFIGGIIDGRYKLIIGQQIDASVPTATTPDERDALPWTPPYESKKPYFMPLDCGEGCLFDLKDDPKELIDLRYSIRYKWVLAKMQKKMKEAMEGAFQAHTIGGEDATPAREAARKRTTTSGEEAENFWGPWQEELPDDAFQGLKIDGEKIDGEGGLLHGLAEASACQSECKKQEKCLAWSFQGVSSNKKNGKSNCALFEKVYKAVFLERFNWISGVKESSLLPDPKKDPPAPAPPARAVPTRRRRRSSKITRRRRSKFTRRRRSKPTRGVPAK